MAIIAITRQTNRSPGVWIAGALVATLLLAAGCQLVLPLARGDLGARAPVAVSRVTLEAHPEGVRIALVVVDRAGQDTTADGELSLQLREPDGAVWSLDRSLDPDTSRVLPVGSLLADRIGYAVVVPASAWARAPRRGGAATISVTIQPRDGTAFGTIVDERFP